MLVDHIDITENKVTREGKHYQITTRYNVGDEIVFNHITTYDNEFNGKILKIQIRKNSRYPQIKVLQYLTGQEFNIDSFMLVRKGKDGKGLSTTWD